MILSTMFFSISSMCLGFATQSEINLIGKQESIIETENSIDDSSVERPILEKCKKKKK